MTTFALTSLDPRKACLESNATHIITDTSSGGNLVLDRRSRVYIYGIFYTATLYIFTFLMGKWEVTRSTGLCDIVFWV